MRDATVGTLLVMAAAAGFGTIGIFGELAVRIDLGLATLLPVRFALATAAVAAVARRQGWSLPASRRAQAVTFGLGVVYTGMTLAFFTALRFLTAGLASIVLYTYPAMVVALAGTVMDEAVTARKLLAVGLAMGGVALVVRADAAGADPLGVGLALGAAACYAVYTAGSRAVLPTATPRGVMLGVLIGTTASMAAYGVLDGGLRVPAGRAEWGVILGIAVVSTVLPHLLFYEGLARLEAGRVGVVSTVEPVVTVALGALLLGEPVTPAVLLGGALVLAGVVLARSGAARPTREPHGSGPARR